MKKQPIRTMSGFLRFDLLAVVGGVEKKRLPYRGKPGIDRNTLKIPVEGEKGG
jgi:hypothetical protein